MCGRLGGTDGGREGDNGMKITKLMEVLAQLSLQFETSLQYADLGEEHAVDARESNQEVVDSIAEALIALAEKQERKNPVALTIKELREMGGEPVWIEKIAPDINVTESDWASIDGPWVLTRTNGIVTSWSCAARRFESVNDADSISVESYGKTWLAYAHKPAEPESEGV